jgi:predicted nucleic acid-binding protein
MTEFAAGVACGRVPPTDWSWLSVLALSEPEQASYRMLLRRLNAGEAACLAIAAARQARLLTDDRDARAWAAQMQVATSGTLGILVRLIRTGQQTCAEANLLLAQMIAHGYRSPVETLDSLL